MVELSDILNVMPKMLTGEELVSKLTFLPKYDASIRHESAANRLIALSDLYQLYLPSPMSTEIYNKLYLALARSLQKKGTKLAVQQRNENNRAIQHLPFSGIIGGSDSFSILGCSGIGKSSAISRAISLITTEPIIEVRNPYCKIIPCLIVQCRFDSSVKGFLLEILRKADERLGTTYYSHAIKSRASTTDVLIGAVSNIALNNIGLLVVDEIQNVANSKNGKALVGALTQLINSSGISICMVGTTESAPFFEQVMQLARRSIGLQYNRMEFDEHFVDFCSALFQYQYVRNPSSLSHSLIPWLYEHPGGITSVVVSLVHDSQEIAILNGTEEFNLANLNEAYHKRLSLIHTYIGPTKKRSSEYNKLRSRATVPTPVTAEPVAVEYCIRQLVDSAKADGLDIVEVLRRHMPIVEVSV